MKSLQVAVPCPKKWEELTGGESLRFCDQCQKHVHHLSMSSPRETERLTHAVEAGARVCVAYFQTPTGTILQRPSPMRRWLVGVQSILAVLLPWGVTGMYAEPPASGEHRGARLNAEGEIVMGKPAMPPKATPTPPMIRGEAVVATTPAMILGDSVAVPSSTPKR